MRDRLKQDAFTLIELLATVAIISIIVLMGIPAFTSYTGNALIRQVAEEIQAGMQQAKFEAIHRNAPTTFSLNGTAWTIVVPAISGSPQVNVASRTANRKENTLSITPSTATVQFNSYGETTTSTSLTLLIASPSRGACANASGPVRCLQVTVSGKGQIRVCDPALASTDPRGC